MGLHGLIPMLRTRNLKESLDFYIELLCLRCRDLNEDWCWAYLERDSVAVMMALPNEHEPFEKPAFTGSLYIRTDDVDLLWQQLKDKVNVCYPIEDFQYGMREFAIYDNNGYLLQFGQEIPSEASGISNVWGRPL